MRQVFDAGIGIEGEAGDVETRKVSRRTGRHVRARPMRIEVQVLVTQTMFA